MLLQYNFFDTGTSTGIYVVLGIFVVGLVVLIVMKATSSRPTGANRSPRANNKHVFLRTEKKHRLEKKQAQRIAHPDAHHTVATAVPGVYPTRASSTTCCSAVSTRWTTTCR